MLVRFVTLSSAITEPNLLEEVFKEYSELFSGQLGTVKRAEHEIDLVDQVLVASHKSNPSSEPQGIMDSYSTLPLVTWEAVTVVEGIP
jgi:hypothetical protein